MLKQSFASHPRHRTPSPFSQCGRTVRQSVQAAAAAPRPQLSAPRSGSGASNPQAADEPMSRSSLLRASAASLSALLLMARQPAAHAAIIEEDAAEHLYNAAGNSVVSILVRSAGGGEGLGSGIVWDRRGHVITNYHVVQKIVTDRSASQALSVTVGENSYPAMLLGTDADHDIAVLRVDAPSDVFSPVSVGQSRGLRVGQSVFAIGSPFGYGKALSTGVVSGINRAIPSPVGTTIRGAIQTDAAISSGNSGGPLLDSSGRLVGINTTSFTRLGTGRSSGVNFAIPVDLVMSIAPNLILSGTNRSALALQSFVPASAS